MTTTLEQNWDKAIIQLNETYRPNILNQWISTLNLELQRQFGLSTSNFTTFKISDYNSLSECREALRKLYYSNKYREQEPTPIFTFKNTKTNQVVKIREDMIESQAKPKLGIAPSSVNRLINDSGKVMKNWRFINY